MAIDNDARGLAAGASASVNVKSLMARIRASYQASRYNNVYINPPLIAPPAWTISTAYSKSQVVAANGNWYVCINPGTSASSGGGPSAVSVAGGGFITDGTAWWTYVGPAVISSNDTSAPTLTQYSVNPNFGVTFTQKAYPQCYAVYGAYANAYDGSNHLILNSFLSKAATYGNSGGRRVEAYCDGANVLIDCSGSNSSSFCRIAVDQFDGKGLRFVTPGGLLLSSPMIKLAWGSAKKRRYVVFFSTANYDCFNGFQSDSGSIPWAPSQGATIRAVTISDSTFQGSGYGPFLPGNDMANRLAITLGIDDVRDFSTPGTGELNPGASSYYTFGQRIPEALALNPSLWLIAGSVNDRTDNGYTSPALTAAALATMQAIRAGGNTAPIIRAGCWPIIDSSTVAAAETAVQSAYTSFAASDPYAHGWVGVSSSTPPVVVRPFNNGGFLPSNVNQYLGGDGHPVDWGTAHYADRLVEGIMTALAAY